MISLDCETPCRRGLTQMLRGGGGGGGGGGGVVCGFDRKLKN